MTDRLAAPPVPDARPVVEANDPRHIRRAVLATSATALAAAAIGLGRPLASLGTALFVAMLAIGIAIAARLPRPAVVLVAGAAATFLPWLAIRSSPWLLVPDLIAFGAVAALATTVRNGSGVRDSSRGYRRRIEHAVRGALTAPAQVRADLVATTAGRASRFRQIAAPAAVGIGVAVVVAAVLASGDALFASYLDLGDLVATGFGRFSAALFAIVVVVAAGGAASGSERRPPIPSLPVTSARSAFVVALPLVGVYVAYVAVQCSTLLLGAEYVHGRTGLTFAEYARSGFFQLVAVGALTFVGLALIRPIVRDAAPRARRRLRAVALVATGCTIGMVVAAIVKLQLYADAFGLTMLRLHTSVFAAWLGIALLIGVVSLFRIRGEWVVALLGATALVGVAAMNVVDPERVVAHHNLTATIDTPDFDIDYLLGLSPDAVPTIVAHLDALSPADHDRAVRRLCVLDRPGGLDLNLATTSATDAVDALDLTC